MKLVNLALSALLLLNTFNVAPIFAEEPTEIEETVEISEPELDVVQTIEEVPEVEVLSEEVLPVEQVESEEVPVKTEEPVETETDLSEPTETTEEVSEEVTQSDIVEPTPTPTSEIDSELVQENVEVESTPIPTPEPTLAPTLEPTMLPEPTATPESEELETVSEVEVVEEVVEEEMLMNASGATRLKETLAVDNDKVYDNIEVKTEELTVDNDRYFVTKDGEEYHYITFDIPQEDLTYPGKYLIFEIKNETGANADFTFYDPTGKIIDFYNSTGTIRKFRPNDIKKIDNKIKISGLYRVSIVTYKKGKISFALYKGDDDYGDSFDELTTIDSYGTYYGKINFKSDIDHFKITAESSKINITFSKPNSEGSASLEVFRDPATTDIPDDDPFLIARPIATLYIGDDGMPNVPDKNSDSTTVTLEKGKTCIVRVRPSYGVKKLSYLITLSEPKELPKVKATAIYNSAHGADIRWKPIEGIQYYGIWRKRTNPITKAVEEKMIYVADANQMTELLTPAELTKENGKVEGLDEDGNYKFVDKYLKDKYTDAGNEWQGGWVYYITARNSSDMSETYNDGKHLDVDGPISNKLNLYRLKNPKITSITANGNGKVTVTWNNVTNAFGYEVQYTLDNGNTWTKVPEVIAATWGNDGREAKNPNYKASVTVNNLPKGKKVNFRIRCRKTNADLGDTWSEYSPWRSTTVK